MKTRSITPLVAFASVLAMAGPSAAAAASGQNLCVSPNGNGCFHTIQAAVNAASAGAHIQVGPGTYSEMVTVTRSLTLKADNGGNAIIDATGHPQGVMISGAAAAGTTVRGFTVENALREGILAVNTSHVQIQHNIVRHNDLGWVAPAAGAAMATCPGANPFDQDDCGEGLHFNGVSWSTIDGNTVERNVGGILLTDEAAATHDNVVSRNTVQDNDRDCGITLPSHPAGFGPLGPLPGHGVYHNTISNNLSTRNGGAGVGTFTPTPGTASYDNLIIGNTLTNNGLGGVALHSHAFGQNLNGNQVIGNTIAGNGADDDAQTGGPVGIVIFADPNGRAAPITGMTISHNTVSQESIDVWIGKVVENLSLHDNNLLGAGMIGVKNAGTGTINASNNFWGCAAGPGAAPEPEPLVAHEHEAARDARAAVVLGDDEPGGLDERQHRGLSGPSSGAGASPGTPPLLHFVHHSPRNQG